MKKVKVVYFLPLIVVAILLVFFIVGLQRDPRALPSVLLDRPVPTFSLPGLPDRDPALTDPGAFQGKVVLLNFFGSWCVACLQEHPVLKRIQAEGLVPLHGIAFKDKPEDTLRWLGRHGDPYDAIGYDTTNRIAIEFGVTGAPETFVIDKQGVIRHKHVGPITDEVWVNTLRPLIEDLQNG
ncbi:DsbE family thiol:disulfide interchange protein [Roseospira marina]|uniref:DsbE family thiol:disulfide interchange protein n=1 Tax=Roseospira marina TaxID=140057 RepID=A0A5M6IBI5_9PROT|nr:DsbE family thiol:disulfide interchange protein [Roseospira marina]KAA5605095.1 DsbE family thiol:disulfide interchange protein [Roseospira marina]MBB4314844.1 cytochrome c biogenesis protein CcmG/thiol:disulfide interchange protein DsbE [Roseospira marina]MBB5087844.1 cytochrome c biogenesis protein CcmG/thiol:disulfide interchange protein DsbE [Roseospira marina]